MGGGSEQWNYNASCSNKKKITISLSWTAVRSMWSIISTNHMTPLCDHLAIHSALTNKQQHGGRGELDCGKCRFSEYKQWCFGTASSRLLCGRVEKNRKYKVGHVTFVHLRIFCWDFDSVRTENVLQWKKNYNYGNSLKIGVGQQKIVLFCFFFSAYCNSPCLSIQRGRYVCHCFWGGKKKLWLFDKNGPMIQTLSV